MKNLNFSLENYLKCDFEFIQINWWTFLVGKIWIFEKITRQAFACYVIRWNVSEKLFSLAIQN